MTPLRQRMLQQLRRERHIPVASTLTLADVPLSELFSERSHTPSRVISLSFHDGSLTSTLPFGDPNSIEPAAVARRTSGFLQTALSDCSAPASYRSTQLLCGAAPIEY